MRLGSGIVVGVVGLLTMVSNLVGPARPVGATPTALAAKALPDLLAPDEGSLALFPASAAGFGTRLVYDRRERNVIWDATSAGGDHSWFVREPLRPHFALALGGRGPLRAGYLLDGDTHTLLLAGTGGWGLSVGWRGNDETEDRHEVGEYTNSHGEVSRSDTRNMSRIRDLGLRLGLGGLWRLSDGRLLEVAVGGGPLGGTIEFSTESRHDTTVTGSSGSMDREGGVRIEAAVRTVCDRPGILAAAHYRRDRWDARDGGGPKATRVSEACTGQLGWRVGGRAVDDVSVGCEGAWSRLEESGWTLTNQEETVRRESTLWVWSPFVSLEERVNDSLALRGGLAARMRWEIVRESDAWNGLREGEATIPAVEETRRETHATFAPAIRLGGAWRWRTFVFDAWLENEIDQDYLFMRWAVSLGF